MHSIENSFQNAGVDIRVNELHKAIYESSPIGIAIAGAKGKFITANSAYINLVGYSHTELVGKSFFDITKEEFWEYEKKVFNACIEDKSNACRVEKAYIHKSGYDVWVDISMRIIMDERANKMLYAIAIVHDVSAQKNLENALIESESKLREKNVTLQNDVKERIQELEITNQKLAHSNSNLEAFAYAASHDLKEPLKNIHNFTNLLINNKQASEIDTKSKKALDFILKSAERMNGMIENILEYSVIKEDHIIKSWLSSDLIFKSVQENLLSLIQENEAQVNLPKSGLDIFCNAPQIELVMQNLISNAIKFNSNNNPVVTIELEDRTTEWIFSCKDNGIGIPEPFQTKIFELFQRLHNKDTYEGSGIGLAICQKIIRAHGGNIKLASSSSQGSTFTFMLPKPA